MTNQATQIDSRRSSDLRAITSLVEQDTAGDVTDHYLASGSAVDVIERWYEACSDAGDTGLIEIVDRIGVAETAALYELARHANGALDIQTSKGNRRFTTVESAAAWLVEMRPSWASVLGGSDIEWSTEADDAAMVAAVVAALPTETA